MANAGFTYSISIVCLWQVFPVEVLELQELVCLKMRNNPVREIPSGKRERCAAKPDVHVCL